MKTIILDSSKFTSIDELHAELKLKFNFPDYYGNNLDALWDCLTTDIELPITVCLSNFEKSKTFLGDYANMTFSLLKDVAKYHGDGFILKLN